MTVATEILAEGKTKILRPSAAPDEVLVRFKDAATAFNGKKYAEIPGKGELNATISGLLFKLLEERGIPTCFRGAGEQPGELRYQRLTMIPLEVVARNFAYGSIVKRFGFEEGMAFHKPLVEFFHKTDDDPQITEALILELNLVPTESVLEAIKLLSLQINEIFLAYFTPRGIRVGDFKLEFGFDLQGKLVLGDELSPDNFRLRDISSGAVLDKDVFRLDLADLGDTYRALLARMQAPADATEGDNARLDNAAASGNARKDEDRSGRETGPFAATGATGMKQTYTGEVFVTSRKNILNPESKAILESLHVLGYPNVETLHAGKRFVIRLEAPGLVEAERELRRIAETVLSNPVVEDYELRIKP